MIDWTWFTSEWLLPTTLGGAVMYVVIYLAGFVHGRWVKHHERVSRHG